MSDFGFCFRFFFKYIIIYTFLYIRIVHAVTILNYLGVFMVTIGS